MKYHIPVDRRFEKTSAIINMWAGRIEGMSFSKDLEPGAEIPKPLPKVEPKPAAKAPAKPAPEAAAPADAPKAEAKPERKDETPVK